MKKWLTSLYEGYKKAKLALLVIAAALYIAVVCYSGGQAGELLLFALVMLCYVVLPGLLAVRLLARLPGRVRRAAGGGGVPLPPGYGGPLAVLLGVGGFAALYCLAMGLGALWLLRLLPPALAMVYLALKALDTRRGGRAGTGRPVAKPCAGGPGAGSAAAGAAVAGRPGLPCRLWAAARGRLAAIAPPQLLLVLLFALLLVLFTFYGAAKNGRPLAVGAVLPNQDLYWNVGNAESFKLAFPPQDIRFVGVQLRYHYLTELFTGAFSIVSGISCYNILAFYLQPWVLGALVLCLYRFARLVWGAGEGRRDPGGVEAEGPCPPAGGSEGASGGLFKPLLFTWSMFLFSCASLWKILPNGLSVFWNANITHLVTNVNSQATAVVFLCVVAGLFTHAARRRYRVGPVYAVLLLCATLLLCLAKGPLAALVVVAAVLAVLVGLPPRRAAARATEATGVAGTTGTTEAAGTARAAGATGAAGTAGATGVDEATGATEATGAARTAGATGAAGIAGATGVAGTTGTTEAAGATGAAGTAGATGIDEATGATDATEAAGETGTGEVTGAITPAGELPGAGCASQAGWRGVALAAGMAGVFAAVYLVLFSGGANESMSLSLHGTLETGWFRNILQLLKQTNPRLWQVVPPLLWLLQSLLMLPAQFPLYLGGVVADLRRFTRLPQERLFFNAMAVGGLAAYFLFSHPHLSQAYFLYAAIFFVNLLAVDGTSRLPALWRAAAPGGHVAGVLKRWLCRGALAGMAVLAAVGVATTGFLYVHMLGSGARQLARNLGLAEKYPYELVLAPDDEAAMLWLRENTPRQAVFATNRIHTGGRLEGISNVYTALSGRQAYMEGFQYARTNMGVSVEAIGERVVLNETLFSAATPPGEIARLCEENGIDYLVFTTQMPGALGADTQLAGFRQVWDSAHVRIYQVAAQ